MDKSAASASPIPEGEELTNKDIEEQVNDSFDFLMEPHVTGSTALLCMFFLAKASTNFGTGHTRIEKCADQIPTHGAWLSAENHGQLRIT